MATRSKNADLRLYLKPSEILLIQRYLSQQSEPANPAYYSLLAKMAKLAASPAMLAANSDTYANALNELMHHPASIGPQANAALAHSANVRLNWTTGEPIPAELMQEVLALEELAATQPASITSEQRSRYLAIAGGAL